MLSSVYGRIEHLLIVVEGNFTEDFLRYYADLVRLFRNKYFTLTIYSSYDLEGIRTFFREQLHDYKRQKEKHGGLESSSNSLKTDKLFFESLQHKLNKITDLVTKADSKEIFKEYQLHTTISKSGLEGFSHKKSLESVESNVLQIVQENVHKTLTKIQNLFSIGDSNIHFLNEKYTASSRPLTFKTTSLPQPSKWVRDAFVVGKENGRSILFESEQIKDQREQNSNRYVADFVAAEYDYCETRSVKNLYFEGGNILAGEHFVLIGRQTLEKNVNTLVAGRTLSKVELNELYECVKASFKKLFNQKHIFWVGTELSGSLIIDRGGFSDDMYQPFVHIDLFLTLGGKTQGEQGNELEMIFVGKFFRKHYFEDTWKKVESDVLRANRALDEIANWFTTRCYPNGDRVFQVKRLPMVLVADYWGNGEKGYDKKSVKTYNNCLVEYYMGSENQVIKKAYLPLFRGIEDETFDKINYLLWEHDVIKAFEEAGFYCSICEQSQVIFIDGHFDSLAYNRGALHCVTQVLKRGAWVESPNRFVVV